MVTFKKKLFQGRVLLMTRAKETIDYNSIEKNRMLSASTTGENRPSESKFPIRSNAIKENLRLGIDS